MKKIKVLIFGYSSFAKRRIIPSFKKNKKISFAICSNSLPVSKKEKVFYNNLSLALKQYKPNVVYISKINSLHFKFAKLILNKGFNLIVDKPATINLKETVELLKIAKKKRLLFAEATLFNYHETFKKISDLCDGFHNVEHIQSNFTIPFSKNLKKIKKIKGDCENDMSPYAASIIRLFFADKVNKIIINKNYFKGSNIVKNFCILAASKKTSYFGTFAFQREYDQQIIFYTKDKIIYSPKRVFAPPFNKKNIVIWKTKNKIRKTVISKNDCIKNFMEKIIKCLNKKNYKVFYDMVYQDCQIRHKMKKLKF